MSVKIKLLLPPPELGFVRRLRYEKLVDRFIERHIGLTRRNLIEHNHSELPANSQDTLDRFWLSLQENEPDYWQDPLTLCGSEGEDRNGLLLTESVFSEDGWTDTDSDDEESDDQDLSIIKWYDESRNKYENCHCSELCELETTITNQSTIKETPIIMYERNSIDGMDELETTDSSTCTSDEYVPAVGAYVEIPFEIKPEPIGFLNYGFGDNVCESRAKRFENDNELPLLEENKNEGFWNYPIQPHSKSMITEPVTPTPQGFWNYDNLELHTSRKNEELAVELLPEPMGFWNYPSSSSQNVVLENTNDIQAERIGFYIDTNEYETTIDSTFDRNNESIRTWNYDEGTSDMNAEQRPSSPTEFVSIPNIPAYPNGAVEDEIYESTYKYIITIDVLKARIQALDNRN